MEPGNYHRRVLHKLAVELEFPKLNFQVIRRMIATLGKSKGHVKDIPGILRHFEASTTTDVNMQSLEPEIRTAVNSIHDELMSNGITDAASHGDHNTSNGPGRGEDASSGYSFHRGTGKRGK